MSDPESPRFAADWLALRRDADAAARSTAPIAALRAATAGPDAGRLVVADLGCGIGSMGDWLAARLPGPQHWVLYDHDPDLLALAGANPTGTTADGGRLTTEVRQRDLTRLAAGDLAGTGLVTGSALLDLLTFAELDAIAGLIVEAHCPALLTLSVIGRVELTPADPLDMSFAAAFNDHQRRGGRLGPDAVRVATGAFARRGATVRGHPSPWRLGPERAELASEWLRGWVGAACAQRPALTASAGGYLRDRLDACAAGALRVVVWHRDLLVLPARRGTS